MRKSKIAPLALGSLQIIGPCCVCRVDVEHLGTSLRNIIALPFEHPEWDRRPIDQLRLAVWGCLRCGLPAKGALAVVCDSCMGTKEAIKDIIAINTAHARRIEITEEIRAKKFDHDMRFHQDEAAPE